MKKSVLFGLYAIGLLSLMLMGFQCSSKEMTSAKLYIQRKEYENATKQLEAEVAKNPKNEEAWYLLAQVRAEGKNFRGMKDAFVKAVAAAPTHKKEISDQTLAVWGHLFNQGVDEINKAQDSAGYYDKAIESFKLAMYVMPESLSTQLNLGFAYYRKGDNEAAIPILMDSFEKGKSAAAVRIVSSIYLLRADGFHKKFTEDNKDAIEELKNLDNVREKMKSIDVKFFIGQPSSVKKDEIKGKGKNKSGTVSNKEEWFFEKYNLVLSVDVDIVTAVKYITPYNPKIDSTNYRLAVAEFGNAIDVLKKAIQLFPEDAEITDNLVNAFIGANRNEEARVLLENNITKFPDNKFYHYNLGVFLLKENKYELSIAEFTEVVRIDPKFSSAIYNLAASYVNWGVTDQERLKKAGKEEDKSYQEKFRKAIPYLEQVIIEKPNDIQILELLGQVYANLGESIKAKAAYDKADAIRNGKN
jgi:tetratricopeptide (TPR) repeat protein